MNSTRTTWLLAALLAVATLVIYSGVLTNHFVEFDDPAYITSNPHVLRGLTTANVRWAFTTFDEANWHPVTWLSHMLDVQLFGMNPAGHHAMSIVIHALNAAFLFLLLFRATGYRWRSLTVAALFAFHPMNVENVAWAAERKSLLCMFFSLATVALYGRFVRDRNWRNYSLVAIAFAFALMSKPMAVTLPVLLLLLDYWPLNRASFVILSEGRADQRASEVEEPLSLPRRSLVLLLREKLPLFAMSAASSIVTIIAQKRGHSVSDLVHLPLSERLSNSAVATVTYVRRTIWPNDLSYFYPHPGSTLTYTTIATAIAILIAITVFVYRFRRHRYLLVGWLLFLVSLLPVIGILQVGMQAMADRYAYLPTIGLFIAIVWGVADLCSRFHVREFVVAAAATAALGCLAGCTIVTEHYWHDSVALFTRAHNVAKRPSVYIETNLGAALLDQNRRDEAFQHFRIAESLAPQVFIPHFNVAYLLASSGDLDGAFAETQAALRCDTAPANRARALNLLASLHLQKNDRQHAIDAYRQILALYPDSTVVKARINELQK